MYESHYARNRCKTKATPNKSEIYLKRITANTFKIKDEKGDYISEKKYSELTLVKRELYLLSLSSKDCLQTRNCRKF
jgi:hypothetical protein